MRQQQKTKNKKEKNKTQKPRHPRAKTWSHKIRNKHITNIFLFSNRASPTISSSYLFVFPSYGPHVNLEKKNTHTIALGLHKIYFHQRAYILHISL